jgi:hypothetical protein
MLSNSSNHCNEEIKRVIAVMVKELGNDNAATITIITMKKTVNIETVK